MASRIAQWERYSNTARELEECERANISIITPESPQWPVGLRDLKDAPVLLYVWGSLQTTPHTNLAVIGSRKTTNYGRTITEQFSTHLAYAGLTIVSGLALGIDTIAHQSALRAQQPTIAVLGSGLGSLYPRQNIELAHEIAGQGAVVSEYPLATPPDKKTFPQRNRIVAAWVQGTLVTEMPKRSGAMITSNMAMGLGRPVFAVPGPIDRTSSEGCHDLIKRGATLTTDPEQISQALLPAPVAQQLNLDLAGAPPAPTYSSLPPEEQLILSHLTSLEQSVEDLMVATELPIAQLMTSLLSLELKDLATQHAGMNYTTA